VSSGEADAIRPAGKADFARRVLAIAGIPGAGKTTLASALSEHYGYGILSTGDVARSVDPLSLADGGLADEDLFRVAFRVALDRQDWSKVVILDGIPRNRGQIDLLPYFAKIVVLVCRPDVAKARLLARGRSDDTPELVERRVREQSILLDADHADGWIYQVVGWGSVVNTTRKRPEDVAADMIDFLDGHKKQAF